MPIAQIQILAGRSAADRRLLIARVTEAIVASLGVDPGSVRVMLTEVSPENWGVGGVPKALTSDSTVPPD